MIKGDDENKRKKHQYIIQKFCKIGEEYFAFKSSELCTTESVQQSLLYAMCGRVYGALSEASVLHHSNGARRSNRQWCASRYSTGIHSMEIHSTEVHSNESTAFCRHR